ncbi:MAG TPA: hypothetical protein DEQ61_08695, partial [Streptomyces sp.]|nr:hypothetical protein [Streptomyces sp.]
AAADRAVAGAPPPLPPRQRSGAGGVTGSGGPPAVSPDVRTINDDITLWLGVLSGDVPVADRSAEFRTRGAAHAARNVPLEDALLLQHSCLDVLTRELTSRLVRVCPRTGPAAVGRMVDALAVSLLRPATAAFAAGYRDAARVPEQTSPDRRPFVWCLATGPAGPADGQALRQFRIANPQALIAVSGREPGAAPVPRTAPAAVPGGGPGGAGPAVAAVPAFAAAPGACVSFTAFSHDLPVVPDGLGSYGIVPVENGDTTRAARRAGISAVLARHYGLDHLDAEHARPLVAALDLTHAEREAFLASCLGPLHHSGRNRHLVETLEAYLAHNLCTTAAARSLYVHRHTFAYRMRCIRSLTGLDPDRPYHRLRAELAVLMSRLHNSPAVPQQRAAA